jgi:hypothetical protein
MFANLSLLEEIILDGPFYEGGGLSGPIPPSLGSLPNLHALDAAGNSLSGTLPAGLFDNALAYMNVAFFNRLTGPSRTQGPADVLRIPASLLRPTARGSNRSEPPVSRLF